MMEQNRDVTIKKLVYDGKVILDAVFIEHTKITLSKFD